LLFLFIIAYLDKKYDGVHNGILEVTVFCSFIIYIRFREGAFVSKLISRTSACHLYVALWFDKNISVYHRLLFWNNLAY